MRWRAPDGFTLLELLLAVSLLSLITASIMGGIHLGRRSWETSRASEALDEVESAVRAAAGLLGRSFLAGPDQKGQSLQGPQPVFMGSASGVRFIALSEGGAQWGGLILTEIGVESSPDGDARVAVWTKPYRPKEGLSIAREVMKKTVLAEGPASIRFSYYGAPELAPGESERRVTTWSESWSSSSNLPALVSVTILLRRLGRDMEASAVVSPHQ
jgi:general secretion pathway protein J